MYIRLFKLDNAQIENCNNHYFFSYWKRRANSKLNNTNASTTTRNKYWTVGLKGQRATEKQLAAIGSFQPNSPHAHIQIELPTLIECMYKFIWMYSKHEQNDMYAAQSNQQVYKKLKTKLWGYTTKRSWSSN